MGLKVAIVGLSLTTHNLAPFHDPSWECWGLPWDEGYWLYYDRLFEMHDLKLLESEHSKRPEGYIERLKECEAPLYMQKQYFPSATEFPYHVTPRQYYNSSIAYAMALAIHEADEIAIYGVDMKGDDEFGYQKPNMEYLVGYAEGKGIKVRIPDESPLCKFNNTGVFFF